MDTGVVIFAMIEIRRDWKGATSRGVALGYAVISMAMIPDLA